MCEAVSPILVCLMLWCVIELRDSLYLLNMLLNIEMESLLSIYMRARVQMLAWNPIVLTEILWVGFLYAFQANAWIDRRLSHGCFLPYPFYFIVDPTSCNKIDIFRWSFYILGTLGSVVGRGTMLQAGRSRVQIQMLLDFSIYLILPAALWS
jgi:hypothetical protein